MPQLNYWVTEYKYSSSQPGLYAYIVYMKCLIGQDNAPDALESIESLDREALETASEKYGIENPCILKRLETNTYFTDGEVVYMIVSKDDARTALDAGADSRSDG